MLLNVTVKGVKVKVLLVRLFVPVLAEPENLEAEMPLLKNNERLKIDLKLFIV